MAGKLFTMTTENPTVSYLIRWKTANGWQYHSLPVSGDTTEQAVAARAQALYNVLEVPRDCDMKLLQRVEDLAWCADEHTRGDGDALGGISDDGDGRGAISEVDDGK